MKKFLKIPLLIIGLFLTVSTVSSYAETENKSFILKMYQKLNYEPEFDPEGSRKPSRPVDIYLSESEGLTIPGYNVADILSYEILTVDGDPVAVFTDEEDFISFIFSATRAYEIRLEFEEITLTGFITL